METFQRYWLFVRGIHRFPVNSPHKGQWRGALMFSLICVWINGWVNNGEARDLRRYRAHYGVTVMWKLYSYNNELNVTALITDVNASHNCCTLERSLLHGYPPMIQCFKIQYLMPANSFWLIQAFKTAAQLSDCSGFQGALLLTWINFDPSMHK